LHSVAFVIPAYKPSGALVSLVRALSQMMPAAIVVVDDGSGQEFSDLFREVSGGQDVTVLGHAVNLGKGAALKTGLNHVLRTVSGLSAVVTADADGQHLPEDIRRVALASIEQPHRLVLGVRDFKQDVPLRSWVGNSLTRVAFRLLIGRRLRDTQTGLRGIPRTLVPSLLRVPSTGYEFELDMLVLVKHLCVPTTEVPISTVYLDGNASSHFNPILDSMRIYFVLLRFSAMSFLTALVDNVVFLVMFRATAGAGVAQVVGRLVALPVNYVGARRAVFFSREPHREVLPKYLLLVGGSGLVSYALIRVLSESFGLGVFAAKIIAETTLFIANFTLQRDFVFTRRVPDPAAASGATDWNSYYQSVPATAKLARRYTTRVLLRALAMAGADGHGEDRTIVEIGGANSCFLDRIVAHVHPKAYHVVDNNRFGLDLLRARAQGGDRVIVHEQDVLNLSLPVQADVVFSVGLIEHFDEADTRRAVLAHFKVLNPGGYAIISFPTPTALYRVSRWFVDLIGQWKFHDERPLRRSEVVQAVGDLGQITFEKLLWPLVLTQRLMVFRKTGQPAAGP
jgi:putative flippase GtrA